MSLLYRQGKLHPRRIIRAVATPPRGGEKVRPMIIADYRSEIRPGGSVVVVVCSTRFARPLRDFELELPSRPPPQGHNLTRLTEETVAVCDWIDLIEVSAIREARGNVPPDLFEQICIKAGIIPTPQ